MPRLSRWRWGSRIGAPDILPLSLAKAISEPVKVMAPIATPRDSSIRDSVLMPAAAPNASLPMP